MNQATAQSVWEQSQGSEVICVGLGANRIHNVLMWTVNNRKEFRTEL